MLISFLAKIKDHRRKQGQRYQLDHILLFSILAILSGATSYRKIQAFVVNHYETFNHKQPFIVAIIAQSGLQRSPARQPTLEQLSK